MNTEIHPKPLSSQRPEAATEIARHAAEVARETFQRATAVAKDATGDVEDIAHDTYRTLSSKVEEGVERTKEYAQQAVDVPRDTANHATDVAKDIYQSAALKAGDTLATSKEYVRRNPVPVVLGAIAFGAAIGYMLIMVRRKPTFGERYVDEPLLAVREAILGALAPVAHSVHKGYDSARDGTEKAMNQVHRFGAGRSGYSISDQIGRIGNNLKFW